MFQFRIYYKANSIHVFFNITLSKTKQNLPTKTKQQKQKPTYKILKKNRLETYVVFVFLPTNIVFYYFQITVCSI